MKEKILVLKIGGAILEDDRKIQQFVNNVANLPHKAIIVHGGGRTATDLSLRLGVETRIIEGRRITDDKTLEVATMVYAGLLNKNLVALLQAQNIDALGLSGADLNIIQSIKRKVESIDYGFVGDVEIVNTNRINFLITNGITPVFSAITHDKSGQLLNTNADSIATHIAEALSDDYEVELYFCFEKNGVLFDPNDNNSLIESISYSEYKELKLSGQISLGMIPKLDNAFYALIEGVDKVMICHVDELADYENIKGTLVCRTT